MMTMIDLAMDLCALCAVQLGFGALRWRRLLLAEAVLWCATRLSFLLGAPGALAQGAVCLLCAAALVGVRQPKHVFEAALCLLCAFCAGAGLAALGGGARALAPVGMLAVMALTRRRRNERGRWNVELYVELGGAADRFGALIDTGNRLRDPRSGLSVLIVEASAAPHIDAAVRLPGAQRPRVLSFGVLGSAGELRCYRPERVELCWPGKPPQSAPPCLVGIFPGRIPGFARALAPPEFAGAAAPAHTLRRPVKFIMGRYRHGNL